HERRSTERLQLSVPRIVTASHRLTSFFFFHCYGPHQDLHSFPTRRSSDLCGSSKSPGNREPEQRAHPRRSWCFSSRRQKAFRKRSEEHTSELQSRFDLVCRLLLEKKKK